MKFIKTIAAALFLILLIGLVPSSFGFALLGPFAPWMQSTNGVVDATDIGGPMDIGSGYRWNVPVITYGFDKSFLDFFGSNGVAAVESAIKILNDLPPASKLEPTNYSFDSVQANYFAQVQGFYDLKSLALASLVEQLGLAKPTRNIFVMKQWTNAFSPALYPSLYGISTNDYLYQSYWQGWAVPDFIVARNFDPETLEASQYLEGSLYNSLVQIGIGQNWMYNFPINAPFASDSSFAVADQGGVGNGFLNTGDFFTGLTYDDVGGLRYLLSAGNVNYEKLLPDVHAFNPNGEVVNGAWRPGIEKIKFVRQPSGLLPGSFRPFFYSYKDFYFQNNVLKEQPVARITLKPDVLFCAGNNTESYTNINFPMVIRTGTAKWQNYAAASGNTNGEGPGVIQSSIKITFHKQGVYVLTDDSGDAEIDNLGWGAFDKSTNLPVAFPVISKTNNEPLAIKFYFLNGGSSPITNQLWSVKIPVGGRAALQISYNQISWDTLMTVTNAGAVIEWWYEGANNPSKFFRAIPQ